VTRVLVTGATGFVGRHLVDRLARAGLQVRGAVRRPESAAHGGDGGAQMVAVGEIGPGTEWDAALEGVDVVVHLAGRAHVMQDRASDPLAEYRRVNLEGTTRLAARASAAGVKRLVFVSSVKVNGEATHGTDAFREDDRPAPLDPYGTSKWEAEQALRGVAGLETVVVRPPLVYGPGVRANFLRMVQSVARGLPLPVGAVNNRRSLVFVGNLADALRACALHPRAAGETFLVSDGADLSTPELVRAIARHLDRPARLVPFPVPLLRLAGRAAGRGAQVDRLCGSLVVDGSRIRGLLDWRPPFTADQGLAETARWFREARA
jgi:nucleoside-diphosphate-sugar epimerase